MLKTHPGAPDDAETPEMSRFSLRVACPPREVGMAWMQRQEMLTLPPLGEQNRVVVKEQVADIHGGGCAECGSEREVEYVADLAPGEPWLVCRPCLDRFAEEALVAELRRRRVPMGVIERLRQRQVVSRRSL